MLDFGVSTQKQNALLKKMDELGIREEDLIEKFIRSGGAGGQNVNKVATCVYLKHVPTGVEVKEQRERSQALNRFLARRTLVEKIESMVKGKASEEQRRREKIRRQKRKRSKRAKEKILQQKKMQAEKKRRRREPDVEE
jgi:protein subunit release factor B